MMDTGSVDAFFKYTWLCGYHQLYVSKAAMPASQCLSPALLLEPSGEKKKISTRNPGTSAEQHNRQSLVPGAVSNPHTCSFEATATHQLPWLTLIGRARRVRKLHSQHDRKSSVEPFPCTSHSPPPPPPPHPQYSQTRLDDADTAFLRT
jgi:hypothetical protein